MLREVSAAEGVYVWRYGDDGELVTLVGEQNRLLPELRATLEAGADDLLDRWRDEPEPIRRCLLWLLSVLPDHRTRHGALIDELLPDRHRAARDFEVSRAPAETWVQSDEGLL